jgi:DNA-binding MarR family transcriptional regulator
MFSGPDTDQGWTSEIVGTRRQVSAMTRSPHALQTLASVARDLLSWERRRATLIPHATELFGDPAWQVLLDLYVEEAGGRSVPISSACIAADVPYATALRWLQRLEAAGLIERAADPRDRRRTFVRLSGAARTAMTRWLAEAPTSLGVRRDLTSENVHDPAGPGYP